jgi:hypothetical protein
LLCSPGWPWTPNFLLPPPQWWDYRHVPPCWASSNKLMLPITKGLENFSHRLRL